MLLTTTSSNIHYVPQYIYIVSMYIETSPSSRLFVRYRAHSVNNLKLNGAQRITNFVAVSSPFHMCPITVRSNADASSGLTKLMDFNRFTVFVFLVAGGWNVFDSSSSPLSSSLLSPLPFQKLSVCFNNLALFFSSSFSLEFFFDALLLIFRALCQQNLHCKLKWFVEEPEKVFGVDAQGEPLRFFLRTIFNGSLEEPTLKQILWFFNEPVCLVKGSSKEPFLNIRWTHSWKRFI